MKGKDVQYVCSQCGRSEAKWLGRCPDCGSWNTFEEERVTSAPTGRHAQISSEGKALSLDAVEVDPLFRFDTGISELDRVLGGGVMRGSSVLIGGEPGIGKSTLMLQVLARCAPSRSVLYVSGEESPSQVKIRAQRLGLDLKKIDIFCDTRAEVLSKLLEDSTYEVVVIDSLQTLSSEELPSPAGSVNQIRYCSTLLVGLCKRQGISLFLVGHVTKEGTLAGPKVIEHLVDTVLYFEQVASGIRLIRAAKNRYGSVDEIGIFSMGADGLHPVVNPASFFISDRGDGPLPPGIAFSATLEGSRSFLVEIQALTTPAKSGYSRIYSDRIEAARVTRIAAILERHAGLRLSEQDIYVNVGGGIKISEVSIELPLALALWSALTNRSLPNNMASFGELSLAGEVRSVSMSEKRQKAAQELGFKRILLPRKTAKSSLTQYPCKTIGEAIEVCQNLL
jgi:DNA repair protein RadA/Sms